MFELVFTDRSLKELQRLEQHVKKRIVPALERITIRPQAYLLRLVGQEGYRLRVGDYRVIMDIDFNNSKIVILKIGHRKNIYD